MNRLTRPWIWLGCLAAAFGLCPFSAADQEGRTGSESLVDQVRQNRRRLWRSNIAPPPDPPDSDEALRREIGRLEAVRLPSDLRLPSPTTQPATAPVIAARQGPPPEALLRRLPPEVLEQLKKAPPKGATRPITLADALFGSGCLDEALVFYEEALKRRQSEEDKAWILFQMANCRKRSDPSAASKLYNRVLIEHPDSPWGDPSGIQDLLLQWNQQTKPWELLNTLAKQAGRAAE